MRKYLNIAVSLVIGIIGLLFFFQIAARYGWATYDLGILQKLFLAAVEMPVIHGLTMLFFALSFPVLYKYIDKDFNENSEWNTLTPKERTIEGLSLWRWYFLCFVLLVAFQ